MIEYCCCSALGIRDDAIRLQLVFVNSPYISLLRYRVRASATAAPVSYAMRRICAEDPPDAGLGPFPRTRPRTAEVRNNLSMNSIQRLISASASITNRHESWTTY